MPRPARLDTDCFVKHGILMISLGMAVCALGSVMVKPIREQAGYLVAAMLLSAGLLAAMLTPELRGIRSLPRRVAAGYVAAGLLMVFYVAIFAFQAGLPEMPLVGLVAALLALYWASRYITLAYTLQPHSAKAIGLCALAAANSSFGVVFATRTGLSRLGIVTMAGCYMIALGVQLYLTAILLHRELMQQGVFDRP